MEPTKKTCRQCQQQIRGRADKKFCNDYCRNAFNLERNRGRDSIVRQIHGLLLRNRRVLAAFLRGQDTVKTNREDLLLQGFLFRYHTHEYRNARGNTYYFCFEYGWLELAPERYLLVRRESPRAISDEAA